MVQPILKEISLVPIQMEKNNHPSVSVPNLLNELISEFDENIELSITKAIINRIKECNNKKHKKTKFIITRRTMFFKYRRTRKKKVCNFLSKF